MYPILSNWYGCSFVKFCSLGNCHAQDDLDIYFLVLALYHLCNNNNDDDDDNIATTYLAFAPSNSISFSNDRYNMLPDWDLLQLPMSQVTKPSSLVVVWVTNRQQQHNFVRDTLFPAWNVCYLTQWFWLKVSIMCNLLNWFERE